MRYTTVIDITEINAVYRNIHARLLYFHMALKAGYHDEDRDILDVSLRRLAEDVGLSVSAVRHALHLLERAKLVTRQGPIWVIKKWLPEQPITSRSQQERQEQARKTAENAAQERQKNAQKAAQEEAERDQYKATNKTHFMEYYEEMERRAAQGDAYAADVVKRHRLVYESHKKQIESTKQND